MFTATVDNTVNVEAPEVVKVRTSIWQTWFNFVCGIPESTTEDKAIGESKEDRLKLLNEKPFWKSFMDVNAIISLCIMFFLLGYFA